MKKGIRFIRFSSPDIKITRIMRSIAVLWTASFLMIMALLYSWEGNGAAAASVKDARDLNVDDKLLSGKELLLDSIASLVNITLHRVPENNHGETDTAAALQERKQVYKKILEQKLQTIRTASSRKPVAGSADKNNDFEIKPVPR